MGSDIFVFLVCVGPVVSYEPLGEKEGVIAVEVERGKIVAFKAPLPRRMPCWVVAELRAGTPTSQEREAIRRLEFGEVEFFRASFVCYFTERSL